MAPVQGAPQDSVAAMPADPGRREPGSDAFSERPAGDYAHAQRLIHWIVAGLVTLQLIGGITIGLMSESNAQNPWIGRLLVLHLINGTLIFGLMCRRLTLRRRLGAPGLPDGTPHDVALLAKLNHRGFYILLLILPILGWIAYLSSGRFGSLMVGIHGSLALVLFLAILAHVAGVAYHAFIRRDGVLQRMLP